jgi:type I restriction enzyme S subunit
METSLIKFSDIRTDTLNLRIDAEHYRKEYLCVKEKLLRHGSFPLKKYLMQDVVTGHTPSTQNKNYYSGNINFIKTDNLRENEITAEFTDKLSNEGNKKIKRSALKENDVLVTIIGATYDIVGRSCLIQKKDLPANINQNIALIRPSEDIQPEFLSIYLNSYYGRQYLWYLSRQTEQVNLNCREVEQILVPKVSASFQEVIAEIYFKSCLLKSNCLDLYSHAEQTLLSELGLLNWKPKHRLSFIRNFSDTQSAGRIDAEFFQPKYDEIIKAVKRYSGGWDILDNLVKIKKSIEPGSDEYQEKGIKFLRVSNLSKFGIDNGSPVYLSEKFYNENKQHQPKQGEILLSKDATPGIAYYLNEKPEEMIVSGGILRLKLKDERVNEDYLTLVLNSVLVQEQAERDAGGSVIIHWRPDQIKRVVVPIVKDNIQKQIQQKVQQSFELRNKSKQLLEIAKKAVEMAIEKDEQIAMKWIEKQIGGVN